MSYEESKVTGHHHQPPPPPQEYGTFGSGGAGPIEYPQQPPVVGFPQPVAPPGAIAAPGHPQPGGPAYYAHGYQAVAGYSVAEGRPLRHHRLPCCGIGFGWFLFIIGFFLVAIPWYVGAFILLCARFDYREKPGYVACTIAAVIATIAIVFGATEGADVW